ncbi:histidine kinase [Chloroflexota bacterium]
MTIHALIPLISSIAYLVLIGATLRYARRDVRHIFGIYLSAAMLWSFCSFQAHWNHFPEHLLLWHKGIIIFMLLVTVTYYHFTSTFTNRVSVISLWLGYGFIFMLFGLTLGGGIADPDVTSKNGLLEYDLGVVEYFLAIFGTCFMVMAILALIQYYRYSTDPQVRNRAAYLLVGAAIVLTFALTNLAPPLSKYPIDQLGNLFNALLITYVVIRYQLLDIRLVIRKGLAYSGLTIGLTTLYSLILLSVYALSHYLTGGDLTGVTLVTAGGLTLLFALILQPFKNIIQQWVDRLFYREAYNYRQTLLTFSQRMSNVLNLSELAENMLYPITKALHTKQAYLLLPEAEGGDFVTRFIQPSTSQESANAMRLKALNPIVTWLAREGRALYREQIDILPEFKSLWETERKEMDNLELELFCPIRRKGALIGVLALSKKHSEALYSNEDTDLLTTMTTEAAMVIENAIILDHLKENQLRTEQLLTETVIAQEEERKRVSVELHDSVAQWLVGASYQTQTCRRLVSKAKNGEVEEELAQIENTIDRSLKEIRRVMAGLHPPALDELGLVPALRQVLDELKKYNIVYHFETTGKPVRFPARIELVIYRIVQESVNNIRKHSGASAVVCHLQFAPASVSVEIRDNGKGFDLNKTMRGKVSVGHMGLRGMRERATGLGGKLEIQTRPGAGTSITLTLPVTPITVTSNLGK